MTLQEAARALNSDQRLKVGADRGTRYFYIGNAKDLLKQMRFGCPELRSREVVEIRDADQAVDPGAKIVMVSGNDVGYYWTTDELPVPALDWGWGWHL